MSAVLTVVGRPRASGLVTRLLREHALLGAAVGLPLLIAMTLCWLYPDKYRQSLQLQGFVCTLLLGLLFALCGYTIYVMLFKRPDRLVHYLGVHLRAYLTRERLLFALPVLLMMPLFASSFSVIKAAVPMFQPFAWDARFAALDQFLHGGVQPWVLLQTVLGHPVMTSIVNFAYHLWFFIMLSTVYWLAFSLERRQLRMQFLLSFVLSWFLLGNLMAMLFSSVGPCFYGFIVAGPDPYAGLLQYLHTADRAIPVMALDVQQALWNDYKGHAGTTALSISAMPSMHVASSVLLALMGWRLNRAAGIALTLFAVLIMVGSVHLAWHYAVDGYVGGLGAWLIWRAVGCLPSLQAGARRGC